MPTLRVVRPGEESSYRVQLDTTFLADGQLWLHQDDTHPDRRMHLWDSVLLDLTPEQDGQRISAYRVTEGLAETGEILFSHLDDAIANAAYRCSQILCEPVDAAELKDLILKTLADHAPHLLEQAEPPWNVRDFRCEEGCALAS